MLICLYEKGHQWVLFVGWYAVPCAPPVTPRGMFKMPHGSIAGDSSIDSICLAVYWLISSNMAQKRNKSGHISMFFGANQGQK